MYRIARKVSFVILAFSLTTAIAWSQGIGKVALVTGEWAPYTSQSMDGKGFFVEIVDAVFKQMKATYSLSFVPWARAEEMVKNGDAFACLPYTVTDERKAVYDFSDIVAKSTGRFFAIKGGRVPAAFAWNTYADLKPYTIGGVWGYWFEDSFKSAGLRVDNADKDDSNAKKLSAMRIDLWPTDELVGWQLIKSVDPQNLGNYFTLAKPLNESALCLMVSRNYPQGAAILAKFNTALDAIKKNGVYKAILAKYNLAL